MSHPEYIVFFDGVCNLCDATVQRIIARDPEGVRDRYDVDPKWEHHGAPWSTPFKIGNHTRSPYRMPRLPGTRHGGVATLSLNLL